MPLPAVQADRGQLDRTYVILVLVVACWAGRMLARGSGRRGVTGYLRVSGIGAPSSSKARRWTGVGVVSFSICLAGEGDGLAVEGGQVAEQVAVVVDGQAVAVVLGGVFGSGLG